MTTSLTLTSRGQVTFRKEVLQLLGLRPGDKLQLKLLPEGQDLMRLAEPAGSMAGFV